MWSRFVFELVTWPREVTLARWTQPSGPLCLWQCFYINDLPYPQLRKFPTFPETRKWAAFCFFLKVVSGGGQVVRRPSYTWVNLVEISSASFHNVPISCHRKWTFSYHTMWRELLGIYNLFNIPSNIFWCFCSNDHFQSADRRAF